MITRFLVWLRGCEHANVRCVHGDEINARNGARAACRDCGASLHRPLPAVCSSSGRPHS